MISDWLTILVCLLLTNESELFQPLKFVYDIGYFGKSYKASTLVNYDF